LNPLIINHAAKTISCTAIGMYKISTGLMLKNSSKKFNNTNVAPIKPSPDIHRGMSFDLYNTKFKIRADRAKKNPSPIK
jgi:hypothetical protein